MTWDRLAELFGRWRDRKGGRWLIQLQSFACGSGHVIHLIEVDRETAYGYSDIETLAADLLLDRIPDERRHGRAGPSVGGVSVVERN